MNGRDAAVAAARRGWAVFPCRAGDKRPAVDRWEARACADSERVARFWPSAGHNIGVACGPSGLVVIDLDTTEHGASLPREWQDEPGLVDGSDVLAVVAERAGHVRWPTTYTVRTPSGGTHLYYRALPGREIRNSAGRVGPMVDVRAVGGYVVGAASIVGGRPYEVIDDGDVEPLPAWLADLLDPPRIPRPAPPPVEASHDLHRRLRGLVETVLAGQPGDRNGRLHWASCRASELVADGHLDRDTAERVLLRAALEAGLRGGEAEARRTIASGMRSVA